MSKQQFYVIGMTDSQQHAFSDEVLDLISRSRVFSGGRRHHEIVSELLPDDAVWIDIVIPLEKVFAQYESHDTVVVFASGDPLFYGFGNTLRQRLPKAEIKVFPAFNSLQMLAHRLLLPYHQMHTISLTGRPWQGLDEALISSHRLIGVLTDRVKTPSQIARRMLEYGYDNYRMSVGECLGNESEEIVATYSLRDVAEREFGHPNCLILERTHLRQRPFGIPEQEFYLLDGREKMITKMPIRLITLSQLDLHHKSSFWDIGFCTGSVSIEAKLQFSHLQITSFELRPEGERLMRLNSRKFGTPGIVTCIGDFLSADLSQYPSPDAVFIGGHNGHLPEIVQRIDRYLQPNGCVVFNSVSESSCRLFEQSIEAIGRRVVARHRITLDLFNPIEIIKAE